MRSIIAIAILSFCFAAVAAPIVAKQKNTIPKGYSTCPSPDQLIHNPKSMLWSAKGGWKTFNVSFATKIHQFLGSQWVGVNLGSIFCLYQGNKMTFKIKLIHPGLVKSPNTKHWSKNLGGYKDCAPAHHQVKDCLFADFKPPSTGNVNNQLDALKGTPAQQLGF